MIVLFYVIEDNFMTVSHRSFLYLPKICKLHDNIEILLQLSSRKFFLVKIFNRSKELFFFLIFY